MLPGLVPVIVRGSAAGAASITFKQTIEGPTAGQTSFTNTHNGGVRTGKWLVTVAYRRGTSGTNTDPTSVSLKGVPLVKIHSGTNGRQNVSVWVNTADIACTGADALAVATGTSNDRCTTSLYQLDNVQAPGTAVDTASATGASPSLNTVSTAGAVMVGVAASGTTTAVTWSGLTKDSDVNPGGASFRVSSASGAFAAAGTQSISATHGSTEAIAIVVSIR